MRLESAHIRNFKLLKDVRLHFSTNPNTPLTVIRAENGSGKTSILHALRWALYGEDGIPDNMRLTSTATAPGEAVIVQVRVEFTTTELFTGAEVRYRLIRTCEEIPTENDAYERAPDRLRLLQRTIRGEDYIEEGKEEFLRRLLPLHLADVFFTNGDAVQRFISGGQHAERERQAAVHEAIGHVLGLEDVEKAEDHLNFIAKELRRELANTGGGGLKVAQDALEVCQEKIEAKKGDLSIIQLRINAIEDQIRTDEKALDSMRSIGDLDTIQGRIHELERDLEDLETREKEIRQQMKDCLRSESLSWHLIGNRLQKGLDNLNSLADSRVIPSTSIEVLIDRLALGVCICGEPLEPGSKHRAHLETLVEEQHQIAPEPQRWVALWHQARHSNSSEQTAVRERKSFVHQTAELRNQYTVCQDRRRAKQLDLDRERQRRGQIDEERVRFLSFRIQGNQSKLADNQRLYGQAEGDLHALTEDMRVCEATVRKEEKAADIKWELQCHNDVAHDLAQLAGGTLATLKSDYVQRVSTRMEKLFLEIIGSDPEADATVITGVSIDNKYDIVIHAQGNRTLDADTELNGASQRALTLAFIWALMEVAQQEAPRIIDTPLGMTSGAVKHRMVKLLTTPPGRDGLPYQVVLFMTRSEIRDIESLIDDRAGSVTTLTCSKDYPVDLVNEWGDGTPIVMVCACNHKEICSVCERRRDTVSNRFVRRAEAQP